MVRSLCTLCFVIALVVAASGKTQAEESCFVDRWSEDMNQQAMNAYDAIMRNVMRAHAPIEYRLSCGLPEDENIAFYRALRASLNCQDSDDYHNFFHQFLLARNDFTFAKAKSSFATPSAHQRYCELVSQIDFGTLLTAEGEIEPSALPRLSKLLKQIQVHISANSL